VDSMLKNVVGSSAIRGKMSLKYYRKLVRNESEIEVSIVKAGPKKNL